MPGAPIIGWGCFHGIGCRNIHWIGRDLQKVDLVIFDCDGVLADSEVISAEILTSELRDFGVRIDTDYVFRNFIGKSFPGVADKIRTTFQVDLPPEFEARYRATLIKAYSTQLRPTPGVAAVLAKLDHASCVATSSSPPRVERTLSILDMTETFGAHVFTASQVERGKPAPDLFLFAADRMGVSPKHCLVIEDSLAGIQAGLAAGMKVWRYCGTSHFTDQAQVRKETPDDVLVFDNWEQFYLMAPELMTPKQQGRGNESG